MVRFEASAGLGLKPQHFADALAARAEGLWFEVHAENYMVDGGPRLAWLAALAERRPISLHGVGLSLAGVEPLDDAHLDRLATLCDRTAPALVSEHLAWSRAGGRYFPDLLPFPRTAEALAVVSAHVDRLQNRLKRQVLIENPALYAPLAGHRWEEPEFLSRLVSATGCGLLLDLNNVIVSAANLGFSPLPYVEALPLEAVGEIHLAGHARDPNPDSRLLIDDHGAPIDEAVWVLFAQTLTRTGPRPTLIERDNNLPPFAELMAERGRAQGLLNACRTEAPLV
ncbi:DUF692 domain-containing protein [Phenylobacterium sp.]|uniref:MNIO family bufferin maturase n=1 Tax=Phenylobacterium sp. TaxID=1871053 RepID=UPI0026319C3F|nr:DUF692 domain-containing protein [Phenylobacterium sp.]